MKDLEDIKLGRGFMVKFCNCANLPRTAAEGTIALRQAAEEAGAMFLKSVDYDFDPQGSSSIVLLAESYYEIHVFPEKNTITAGLYTCGNIDSMKAVRLLATRFGVEEVVGVAYCHDTDTTEVINFRSET